MNRELLDRPAAAPNALLIATDLDGTLLDHETYSFAPARPALDALQRRGARLVLVSSKTRAEMEPLARELGLNPPLIVENGGAVLVPRAGGRYEPIVIGCERAHLVNSLAEIGAEAGAAPRGFSSLTTDEVVALTGLSHDAALRAMDRAHDEPFLLGDEGAAPALSAAAERRGLRVTRGGRFFHLTGDTDKGRALLVLLRELATPGARFDTVGLGDAANDLPLLRVVDRPILIPRRDGQVDPRLAESFPDAERAPFPGPAGWNVAVLSVLEGRGVPDSTLGGD